MITIEFLNYSQEKDKMVKNFKFFHGVIRSTLTATWTHQEEGLFGMDVENDLIRILSEEMSRTIDNEIIDTLTRRINNRTNQGFEGPIQRFNVQMGTGEQRA